MKKVGVGIIGCGAIAPAYMSNIRDEFSGLLKIEACADLYLEAAKKRAAEFGVPRACSVDELLANPAVEVVVNLTNPEGHHPVTMAAIKAGKHVFTEKPLGISMKEGTEIVEAALTGNRTLAGAADIFLGSGLQSCRKLVDDGRIGTPMNATAYVSISVGSERYHRTGYGPMFDLSPYYITSLLAILGPVKAVCGMARIPFPEKTAPSRDGVPGKTFKVETPTNIVGLMEFASGPVAVITASCEVSGYYPRNEIYGTAGILVTNDANGYGGAVTLKTPKGEEKIEPSSGFGKRGRGLGVAEMTWALREGRAPRAGADMLFHVLEIMHAIHESSREGRQVAIKSAWGRPEPFDCDAMLRAAT
jgi:predicted dehydrogenase